MLPYTKKYLFSKSSDTVVRENELLLGGWGSTDPPVRTPDFKFLNKNLCILFSLIHIHLKLKVIKKKTVNTHINLYSDLHIFIAQSGTFSKSMLQQKHSHFFKKEIGK